MLGDNPSHRGMNLSTADDIEYDAAVLKQMSTEELLYQLLCQKLLERPLRPKRMDAEKLQEQVVEQVAAFVEDLRNQNLDFFANEMNKLLERYQAMEVKF